MKIYGKNISIHEENRGEPIPGGCLSFIYKPDS